MKKLKELSVIAGIIMLVIGVLWFLTETRSRAAQHIIDIGPFPDSDLGEGEYFAFQKVNSNFFELYAALGPGLGFSNVGSNTGFGVYRAKIGGTNVQLNMLVAGTNLTIVSNATGLILSSQAGGVTVEQGTNIVLTTNGGVVTINAELGDDELDGMVTNGLSLGSGQPVFVDKTGQALRFKSLTNSGMITLSATGSEITIGGATSNLFNHINISDYGAISDGTGDNWNAFASALTAAAASVTNGMPGRSVYFPSGNYQFTQMLVWQPSWTNIGVLGEGMGRSRLIFPHSGAPTKSSGALTFLPGLGRYKILTSTYSDANPRGDATDYRTFGAPNNTIGTVFVAGGAATNTAIGAGGSGYGTPPTVEFSDVATAGNTRRATGTATISGGAVTGVLITDGGTGYTSGQTKIITFTGGGGSGATATFTVSDGLGIGLLSSPTRTVMDLDADVGSGIRIDPDVTNHLATIRNVSFKDLTFSGANQGNTGSPFALVLLINNYEDILFERCEFATARHAGLRTSMYTLPADLPGRRLTVRDCHFRDIITSSSDATHGAALLTAGGSEFIFSGNTFTNCGGGAGGNIFSHAIYSQQHTNLTVSDNHLYGLNSRLHIISMENKNIDVFDNHLYGQLLNFVSGRNVHYHHNWHDETTLRFASASDIEINDNYFSSTTNRSYIENIFTESARANIHHNRFINLQAYVGLAGLNTTTPAIQSIPNTDNWHIHGNTVYNQQLVRLYGNATNIYGTAALPIIERNTILSISNNVSDGYIFLDYGGTVRDNKFTFIRPVSTARWIEIPSAGVAVTTALNNDVPAGASAVGTTNKTSVLFDSSDNTASVNGGLRLAINAAQIAIHYPNLTAIRSDTLGGLAWFDLGTVEFRDGDGDVTGGSIIVRQNAQVFNKLYVTNTVNGGYTKIESNSISTSGAGAGGFALFDTTGTKSVRQQAPSTVTSNLNVIWPDRPGNGSLYATASGTTNVTLSFSNAPSGLSSPSGYFTVPKTPGTVDMLETWMGWTIAGSHDWLQDNVGGTTVKAAAIDGAHPGLYVETLPATAGDRVYSRLGLGDIAFGSGTHYLEWQQKFATTLSGTPIWRIGFADDRVDNESTDAVYVRYDSGSANWKLFSRSNAGTATETVSSQAVTTAWHVMGLKINADGTSAILYYNGVPIAENTTAIPTGFARSLGISFGGYRALTDGSSQIHYMDYLWYCFSPTTFP